MLPEFCGDKCASNSSSLASSSSKLQHTDSFLPTLPCSFAPPAVKEGEYRHFNWTGRGGNVSSSSYDV